MAGNKTGNKIINFLIIILLILCVWLRFINKRKNRNKYGYAQW